MSFPISLVGHSTPESVTGVDEFLVMVLPLAMLKGLQMRTPVKVGLAGVFGCAFITIGFDILRAVKTDTEGEVQGSTALWTNLESAVAVIVSCLPSLVALFSPQNKRNDWKNPGPYRQRSLVVSKSAKLYMSGRSSVKSGYSGRISTAGESEKSLAPSDDAMSAHGAHDVECEETSIV